MEPGNFLLLHLLQCIAILFIVSYLVINNIVFNKGYLATDSSTISTATAKAKVVGLLSNGDIFDSTDIIYPSLEENALFIATSIINTPNQTRSICTNKDGITCTTDTQCPANQYEYTQTGSIYTGTCNMSVNICSVYSWCPIQTYDSQQIISNIGNGTIFLDINILFPFFDVIITNTYDLNDNGAPIDGYNLFYIDNIIGNVTNGTMNTIDISQKGIIILMVSQWNCNLDLPLNECIPHFSYYRIDSESDTISQGFNVKNAWYHSNGIERILQKRFGIRIIFISYGTATKMNIAVLVFNICIGVILLVIALIFACYIIGFVRPNCNVKKNMAAPTETNEIVFTSPSIHTSPSMSMKYEGNPNETLMGHFSSTNK